MGLPVVPQPRWVLRARTVAAERGWPVTWSVRIALRLRRRVQWLRLRVWLDEWLWERGVTPWAKDETGDRAW